MTMSNEIGKLLPDKYIIDKKRYNTWSYFNIIKHRKSGLVKWIQYYHHNFGYEGIKFYRHVE